MMIEDRPLGKDIGLATEILSTAVDKKSDWAENLNQATCTSSTPGTALMAL